MSPQSGRRRTLLIVLAGLLLAAVGTWLIGRAPGSSGWGQATSSATSSETPAPAQQRRLRTPRFGGGTRQPVALAEAERVDSGDAVGALQGEVVSRANQQPVAGARLTFAAGVLHEVVSDERGRFSFHPEREDVFELALVTAPGYLPFAPEWGHSPLIFVARRGVGLKGARVLLTPAIDYQVTVLSDNEQPVAGAEVRVLGGPAEGATLTADAEAVAITDEEGKAIVHARDHAVVEARHPDHGPGRARLNFPAQVSHRLVIHLAAADSDRGTAAIRGKVLDADGQPAAEALVVARHLPVDRTDPNANMVPTVRALSEDDGSFALEGLDPGHYDLVASLIGFAPAIERQQLAPGELVLQLGRGAGLHGTVREADSGAAVPSFTVVVLERRGPIAKEVVTVEPTFDPEGAYEVMALPVGTYLVTVSAHGYADAAEREVVIEEGRPLEVDFSLGRGGTVRGSVVDADSGEALSGAKASVEGTMGQGDATVSLLVSASCDANGRFELAGLSPGKQSLLVAAAHHHGRLVGISVEAGQLQEITVELTPTKDGEEPRIELAGIGAVLSAEGDALLIGRVIEGGGAEEAGLGPGDGILSVDGQSVVTLGFGGAINAIRGPEGTSVTLTVRRDGQEQVVTVVRRRIRS